MPRLLTEDLQVRFDGALAAAGAPIVDAWRPGLSDDEIDTLSNRYNLRLPNEARAWWRWHNGVVEGSLAEITPARIPATLQRTLDTFAELRGVHLDLDGVDGRLKPLSDAPWIFFACDGPADAPVPIWVGDHGVESRLALPSIGELVATWAELIETGVYRIDQDGEWEDPEWEALPEHVRQHGYY
jgi:hypothetical protein